MGNLQEAEGHCGRLLIQPQIGRSWATLGNYVEQFTTEKKMSDWKHVQRDPSEALAKLHFFSITKKHAAGEIEARITVKEFATAKTSDMLFYATADVELNQKSLKFQPCGWSETLLGALAECVRNLRKFEYECLEQNSTERTDCA